MGIATGEAEQRGEDYFGPALNRAARVMAVGHGGQLLLSKSTAALVTGVDLLDLGEHRLRDLSGAEHLFQVRAEGLATNFPPLKTVNAVPGNLPRQTTSFVGRDIEVKELAELVRAHELVTMTGVGGVGKTRLAIQVAAELVADFPDGVWLTELAPVGDPSAVPDAVATALGITVQAGMTATESIAQALAGRRVLIVIDNCEHVIDAAADLVEAILARSSTVKRHRHLTRRTTCGSRAPVARAVTRHSGRSNLSRGRAVHRTRPRRQTRLQPPHRNRHDRSNRDLHTTRRHPPRHRTRRSPHGVDEPLRCPRPPRRPIPTPLRRTTRLERHQTLRHAVQWSYELLTDNERIVLQHASVFADGFDLAAITHLCEHYDEYTMLDHVDSLVRKSLVTTQQSGDHNRYGLLETIRQFAEDQLGTAGTIRAIRDRHASYYSAQIIANRALEHGPHQRVATDWVEAEFANLRTAFRWAIDGHDLDTATSIASHTTMLSYNLQRFEPVGWAEELLPAATAADVRQLPLLYLAAAGSAYIGRPDMAVGYARAALALETDPSYESVQPGFASFLEGNSHALAGRFDRLLEICTALVTQTGSARILGLCGQTYSLAVVGRDTEAMAIADETLAAARTFGSQGWVAWALYAYGRAFSESDPTRALGILREGLIYANEHRMPVWEANIAFLAAGLEAVHGNTDRGLEMFDTTIESFQHAGAIANTAATLGSLATIFDRFERPDIAATLYGATTDHAHVSAISGLPGLVDHLSTILGSTRFEDCVATGAAMGLADAVRYARLQIRLFRSELAVSS